MQAVAENVAVPRDLAARLETACLPLMEEWLGDIREFASVELKAVPEDDLRVYAFILVRNVVEFVAREVGLEVDLAPVNVDFKAQFLSAAVVLVDAIDAQVSYTAGRSQRVAQFSGRLACMLKISDAEIEDIEYAARICNLGLINASQRTFNMPRRLSPEELSMARNHSQVGADIIKPMEFLNDIAHMIRYHHANWDGCGYPPGIAGEQIPLGARVIRIADAAEAMLSDRPHRRALSRDEAMAELLKDSGKAFDPQLVRHAGAML